jgi:hypothetical protein
MQIIIADPQTLIGKCSKREKYAYRYVYGDQQARQRRNDHTMRGALRFSRRVENQTIASLGPASP